MPRYGFHCIPSPWFAPPLRSRLPPPPHLERLTEQSVLQPSANPAKDETPDQDGPDGAAQRRPDTRRQPRCGCRNRERRDRHEQAPGREPGLAPEGEIVEEDRAGQTE